MADISVFERVREKRSAAQDDANEPFGVSFSTEKTTETQIL